MKKNKPEQLELNFEKKDIGDQITAERLNECWRRMLNIPNINLSPTQESVFNFDFNPADRWSSRRF